MPDTSDPGIAPIRTGPLVLVVDDDQADRIAATRMVRGLGYPVRSFRQGRDALQFVERHPQVVRALIADLGMPVMDGGELAERALDADPSLRAVLMADLKDPEVAELLQGYRDLPILVKPVRFADLYGTLVSQLGPPPHGASPHSVATGSQWSRRRTSGHHSSRGPGD